MTDTVLKVGIRNPAHADRVLEATIKHGETLLRTMKTLTDQIKVLRPYPFGVVTARHIIVFVPAMVATAKILLKARPSRCDGKPENAHFCAGEMWAIDNIKMAAAQDFAGHLMQTGMKVPK